MKICYVADGISIHTQRWVNYFASKGHEVHLISYQFPSGYEGFDKRIEMHWLIRLLPQVWKASRYFSGALWLFQVRRMVNKIQPDILDAHYITLYGYLGVAAGFHPLVLSAWGSDILIDAQQNPIYRFFTRIALKRADRIICVSSLLKEELAKLGVAPERVEITSIGVDTQRFSPKLKNKALLQKLGMADSPVVISTRSLAPVYEVETLIKAIPAVLSEVPEAKFIIVGEGRQRTYLENLAKSLGISKSIKFTGWVSKEEFPNYLASSDVYVSTSLSDGTSISLLEALASALAPVVTDIPANRPWIKDGENGFLIPIGDCDMLAKRIVLLLKEKDSRSRFGSMGRNIAMDRAEFENQMSLVERTYEELKLARED